MSCKAQLSLNLTAFRFQALSVDYTCPLMAESLFLVSHFQDAISPRSPAVLCVLWVCSAAQAICVAPVPVVVNPAEYFLALVPACALHDFSKNASFQTDIDIFL